MTVNGIPVVWKPASSQDFQKGRDGLRVEAIVYHRAVGTLGSVDGTFARGDADPATVGAPDRFVSSHFGIGHINGALEIHQYVDLADTAYCNGDVHRDSPWFKRFGEFQANHRTVSIEHEDNGHLAPGTPGRGLVTPDIIEASIALSIVLRKGYDAIRNAGIRIRENSGVAAQLQALPLDVNHFIDHHYIAGANKPYCWREWAQDPGFPQAKYLAAIKAAESPLTPDATPYSQADLDAAVALATASLEQENAALRLRIETAAHILEGGET